MRHETVSKNFPVLAWWSGGVTSAAACKIAIGWFGVQNVRVIFIDTGNEDEDTYRFKVDCERWYGCQIETIRNTDYNSIQQVWYQNLSLNVATGAKCSQMLKRIVRERFERVNPYSYQIFGFTIEEFVRARGMLRNNPSSRPLFPLIASLLTKTDCIRFIQEANTLFVRLDLPRTYHLGFHNNNCFKTGCVQGGIGYWQKIMREYPDKFDAMARVEHELTDKKGEPVTMLKDQGKDGGLVFLKPHPKYPQMKDITMMEGREPKPLIDCNGFCGTNDLAARNPTESELNYA